MLSNSRVSVGFKMIGGQTLLERNEQKLAKITLGIALARLGPILVLQDLSAMSMGSVIVLPRAEIAKDAVLLFVVAVFFRF